MGIKLVFKGAEEIVILDEIQFDSADEFFEDLSNEAPDRTSLITVSWAEGVVFQHRSFPLTDAIIKEYIEKGRIYWLSVKYAPMEKYEKSIRKNEVLFKIIKVRTPVLIEVAKELKKRLEEV